jgi:hypothetical protein
MEDTGKAVPRELIAFAYVEEEYTRSGDIVRGLMPLFAPLLAGRESRIFDPELFAKSVQETYDIPMSPLVAEGLIPQLAKAGLLSTDPGEPHTYRVAEFQYEGPPQSDSEAFELLLDHFVTFSQSSLTRIGLSIAPSDLKGGLLKRMTDLNFLTFLSRPDRNYFKGKMLSLTSDNHVPETPADPQQALDILCAEFAFHASEVDSGKFELLSRLTKGALVSEVVLTLQTPSADADLRGVTIVLDGPLILDYFDLSTKELKEYSDALFDLITKAKLRKATFTHTLDEMVGTIRAPLEAMQRGEQPYGPLGTRIRHNSSHLAYARAMLSGLPEMLSSHEITLVDATRFETSERKKFCPEAVEDSLRNEFGLNPDSFERRSRDAHSIATVVRMRASATHPRSLPQAGVVMVTRNLAIEETARRVLIFKRLIERDDFPPVLTDRQLAGLLWFAVGGNLGAISRTKLIANCSAALNPRNDITSKLKQYLFESDPMKAEALTALMRDQRARRSLMHETLGFAIGVTRDNADYLLERMRIATADEIRRESKKREQEMADQHAGKMAALTDTHMTELQAVRTELLDVSSAYTTITEEKERDLAARDATIGHLADSVKQLEARVTGEEDQKLFAAVGYANRARKHLRIMLVVLYASLTLAVLVASPGSALYFVLSLSLSVLAFWFVASYVMDGLLRRIWWLHFRGEARRLLATSLLDKYEINAANGIAKRKRESGQGDPRTSPEAK